MNAPRNQDARHGIERRSGHDRRSGLDRRELRAVLLQPDAAMPPRYRTGEAVVIELAAVPQPGDDVMLVLHDGRTLVRELAAIDAKAFKVLDATGAAVTLPVSEVRQASLVVGAARRRNAKRTVATPHAAAYYDSDGRMRVHGWYADYAEAKRQAEALKALHGNAGIFTREEDGDA
ncbi:hypothetical protein [uncultured Azohydromonas sp.]|jgi:hypothetical protein|uniref:hypothetical protein n=1 Tax=uncultured Azohydromonas sp. TaxID=487342 RepID=UPI002613A07B|nr:hypothetical protein [uncultured Azohydromonas sp.]